MEKIGLVLGGGGSRGAYQYGAVKALKELGVNFGVVTGTSVGSLNAALIAQNHFEILGNLWNEITYEKVMKHNYKLKNKKLETMVMAPLKQGMSIEPLEELAKMYINEQEVRSSDIKLGIVVTENFKKYRSYTIDEIPDNHLIDFMMASCSAWPFFKKKVINGKTYYDGGYSDVLPVKLALEMGANKIIAISLMGGFRQKVDHEHVYIMKPKKNKYFFLNFDKVAIDEMISLGYNDVMDQQNEIKEFLSK